MATKRIEYIDAMRGFTMILVVYSHICHLRGMDGISEEERQRLTDNLFVTFSFLLWCVSHNRNVLNKRRAIVSDLRRRVPDLWFSNGIKQNLVSLLFRLMPNIYLKLRSLR